MSKLNASARKKLSKSQFGLPEKVGKNKSGGEAGRGAYPMPDAAHAANAKARATQMLNKGKLSSASAAKIRAKANKILGQSAKRGG